MRYLLLLALAFPVYADNFSVSVPPVGITINGATCTQAGSVFTCNGAPPVPTCPSPPGTGPCPLPPGPISCPGFTNTIVLPMVWASPQRMFTGAFNANDAVVVTFTTAGGNSNSNNLPQIAGAEYGAGAANRIAALSSRPCDFGPQTDYYSYQVSSAPTIPFTVNNPYIFPGLYSNLANNTTYYLNVKNDPGSGCVVNCNMYFGISKNGTP